MTSLGGSRSVLRLVATTVLGVLLVAAAPLMMTWPFGRTHVPEVSVHDEVGVLQAAAVEELLEQLRFRTDVDLAVLTLDADYSDNFNAEVLAYAREHQPQWISARNPNYWEDGLVVLAVSPSGQWVGTYFGEDVKVGTSEQEAIQEEGKGPFRDGDWAGGVLLMGQEAADVVGRPALARAGWLWVTGAVAGLGGTLTVWGSGLVSRRRLRTAERHYANVTRDWDETEVLARTIPEDEPHGAQVLMRYSWFRGRYFELTRRMRELGALKGADWFSVRNLGATSSLVKDAQTLDALDDTIAHASALLTMSSRWREAWDNELGPVYEDAAALEKLCDEVDKGGTGTPTAPHRQWLATTVQDLSRLTADLEAGRVTPSAALDRLDDVGNRVRERALRLSEAAMSADSSTHAHDRRGEFASARATWRASRDPYEGAWSLAGMSGTYVPASTVRLTSSSAGFEGAGVRAGSSSLGFAPLAGLVTGYSTAAAWSPSASSSSGGFGGGGGGFSGAGSSSHF